MTCPACSKAEIDRETRQCPRCKVYVAAGSEPARSRHRFPGALRGDQDRVGIFTDMARYKEDHSEKA